MNRFALSIRATATVWGLLMLLVPFTSTGAEEDKRALLLRDAARSAQAAAQRAQQELATLKQEQMRWTQDEAQREQALSAARSAARASSNQAARLTASLHQVSAERDRLVAEQAASLAAQAALREVLDKARAETRSGSLALDEQRRVTRSLAALLERSVQSLALAEDTNRKLHDLGLQATQAYVEATPEAVRARDEPFLGLAAVRLENHAESLRQAMAEQRLGR